MSLRLVSVSLMMRGYKLQAVYTLGNIRAIGSSVGPLNSGIYIL